RHKCRVCGRGFNRPSALMTHMNGHTGNRPFKCLNPQCTRAFSVNSNMHRHFK
ncbi:hypothetical protein C8Q76DRAFT_586486, partial [Earliella scabrosa]